MRVRIVSGPWPTRIGCVGTIVVAPAHRVYPWSTRGEDEVIVLLDDDPLGRRLPGGGQGWSFAIDRNDLEAL